MGHGLILPLSWPKRDLWLAVKASDRVWPGMSLAKAGLTRTTKIILYENYLGTLGLEMTKIPLRLRNFLICPPRLKIMIEIPLKSTTLCMSIPLEC